MWKTEKKVQHCCSHYHLNLKSMKNYSQPLGIVEVSPYHEIIEPLGKKLTDPLVVKEFVITACFASFTPLWIGVHDVFFIMCSINNNLCDFGGTYS